MLWRSPTFTTWLNLAARMSAMLVVLPLVLNRFDAPDVAIYYLFSNVIGLQLMAVSGFAPTLSRFVTYVLAGARLDDLAAARNGAGSDVRFQGKCDPGTLASLLASVRRGYRLLIIAVVPVGAVMGTLALHAPISATSSPVDSWAAWLVICATTPLVLASGRYSAFLQGADKVALDQRWSALFVIFGALSGLGVMLAGGGLFGLILSNQCWQVFGFFRLRWLAGKILREIVPEAAASGRPDPRYLRAIWPASWRSIIGVLGSNGVASGLAVVFAQFFPAKQLAEFLLATRLMAFVSEVSKAPFYSGIPRMNAMRSSGRLAELLRYAAERMRFSYATFLVFSALVPVAAHYVFPLIGSEVGLPSLEFWVLLVTAQLVERMGAMHVQLYSTTNHIVWHVLNGVTGAIWILLALGLIGVLGYNAYPISMLIAYLCCYSSFGPAYSLRSLHVRFWAFERRVFLPVLGAHFLASIFALLFVGR